MYNLRYWCLGNFKEYYYYWYSIYLEIISAVEPFGLDERRSLYKVEYSVAAKIIRIYIYVYVCLFMCLCLLS